MSNKPVALIDFIDKIEQIVQFQNKTDISAAINSIWNTFVEELRLFISVDACAFFQVDENSREFVLQSAHPDENRHLFEKEVEYQIECDMFSWIINRRIPAVIPSFVFKNRKSIIMLPLSTVKRTIGVVEVLTSIEESLITQENLKLLTMLARQCSLVMENSILYNNMMKKHQALERARDQIASSEKMASIGRLTAGASHEILNPLTIISGKIQLAQLKYDVGDDMARLLAVIQTQTDRIAQIINGMSRFSKSCSPGREKLDIHAVVQEFMELKKEEFNAFKIEASLGAARNPGPISGNKTSLIKMLSLVLSNAMDAMPDGGRVEVNVFEKTAEGGADAGDHAVISFRDSGCGIPENNIPKVTEPFFTTKNKMDRPGLGLSLCYGIIQDHGGRLEIKSREGAGTEVLIYLPV